MSFMRHQTRMNKKTMKKKHTKNALLRRYVFNINFEYEFCHCSHYNLQPTYCAKHSLSFFSHSLLYNFGQIDFKKSTDKPWEQTQKKYRTDEAQGCNQWTIEMQKYTLHSSSCYFYCNRITSDTRRDLYNFIWSECRKKSERERAQTRESERQQTVSNWLRLIDVRMSRVIICFFVVVAIFFCSTHLIGVTSNKWLDQTLN